MASAEVTELCVAISEFLALVADVLDEVPSEYLCGIGRLVAGSKRCVSAARAATQPRMEGARADA